MLKYLAPKGGGFEIAWHRQSNEGILIHLITAHAQNPCS